MTSEESLPYFCVSIVIFSIFSLASSTNENVMEPVCLLEPNFKPFSPRNTLDTLSIDLISVFSSSSALKTLLPLVYSLLPSVSLLKTTLNTLSLTMRLVTVIPEYVVVNCPYVHVTEVVPTVNGLGDHVQLLMPILVVEPSSYVPVTVKSVGSND